MPEVIKNRRAALNLSQADLAQKAGVDRRQIRRYESGDTQPNLGVARALARALSISIDELAGDEPARRVDLSGQWWACWQTWRNGEEVTTPHLVKVVQNADRLDLTAVTRGTPVELGGYLWRGELRLFDNEALIGWYTADEAAVRSKGAMYFALHQHGINMTGRWVGLSYDGPIVTGWAAMARSEREAVTLVTELKGAEAK